MLPRDFFLELCTGKFFKIVPFVIFTGEGVDVGWGPESRRLPVPEKKRLTHPSSPHASQFRCLSVFLSWSCHYWQYQQELIRYCRVSTSHALLLGRKIVVVPRHETGVSYGRM